MCGSIAGPPAALAFAPKPRLSKSRTLEILHDRFRMPAREEALR